MNICEAIEQMQRLVRGRYLEESQLVVQVHRPGSIGGTPSIPVTAMHAGFDWDSGKLLLTTEQPVTLLTPQQVEEISASAKAGQSWHAYQQYKKYQEELKNITAQRDELLVVVRAIKQHVFYGTGPYSVDIIDKMTTEAIAKYAP